ncbi:flavonoid 3',5'-hydroxylase 1-like [Papaver somniferum]|uniref:flavonoid 3',5'-hydroxylase 1-like n=1 Tax=Papaver somniferum TaxID=3469 RepID=UPI000E6F9982|nr:flavonoid 3',5'-hydroxylase 1-like [Papaver somniferum]
MVFADYGPHLRNVRALCVREILSKSALDSFSTLRQQEGARFDLQGVERRLKELISWLDPFFESMIDKRMKLDQEIKLNGDQDGKENKVKDFLQVFQQLQDQGDSKVPFTFTNPKALFMNLVVGGTYTIGGEVEWAMAELIKEPKIMKRALEELENVVGKNNIVEESHIPNLPYLGAIIKETYRLHPRVPLLVTRCPSSTCNVGGYVIPKGAQVLMNAWEIQRDPKYWDDPLEFHPERFLQKTSKFDFIGTDFRYIPFGSGTRRCIGVPLVERIVPYALASFLHSFEWRMPEGAEVDLSEKFGIVLKTSTPLTAIPLPRLSDPNLYAKKEY